MHLLDHDQSRQAAIALPDTPETCIAIHALRSGRGRAWAADPLDPSTALIIDPVVTPGELLGFGDDTAALTRMLKQLSKWTCIEVASNLADALAVDMERALGVPIDPSPDLYFILEHAISAPRRADVRLLTPDDADLYMRSAPLFEDDPEEARLTVEEGPVIAAIVDDRVVASVEANVRTRLYANFTVETLPEFRGQGLCTAATLLAAQVVQRMGLIPLWSCNARNAASRRVAAKAGFTPVSQCLYLIPQWAPPAV